MTVNGGNPNGCTANTYAEAIAFGGSDLTLTCDGLGQATFSGYLSPGSYPVKVIGERQFWKLVEPLTRSRKVKRETKRSRSPQRPRSATR